VGLDVSTSIKKRLAALNQVSPELPIERTVIIAADATIAIAKILVAMDMTFFSVAEVANCLSNCWQQIPVEMDA
jgi:hypothetical protein